MSDFALPAPPVHVAVTRDPAPLSPELAHLLAGELALRLHPVRACASPAEVREWREEHDRLVSVLRDGYLIEQRFRSGHWSRSSHVA